MRNKKRGVGRFILDTILIILTEIFCFFKILKSIFIS